MFGENYKHDFAISKIARGNEKDIHDILEVHRLSPFHTEILYKRFIEEFLFVSAIGSLNNVVLSFLNLITMIEHENKADFLAEKIRKEMIKRGHTVRF